jgi:hypothetical protein
MKMKMQLYKRLTTFLLSISLTFTDHWAYGCTHGDHQHHVNVTASTSERQEGYVRSVEVRFVVVEFDVLAASTHLLFLVFSSI